MIIQTIPIDKINIAAYNPRKDLKPGDPEYEKLKKSILTFDLVEPLVWNKRSGNLVGGHQRLKVLKELGQTEVEVSVVDLPDNKEKALNLALNKISGEWDLPRLKDILEELDTGDIDIEITGFDVKEIEDLLTQFHVPEEGLTDDDEIPEKVEAVCKTGDLWILGGEKGHRLLCGDATKREDVERLMGKERADLVITDPPYGINLDTDSGMKGIGQGNKYRKVEGDENDYDPTPVLVFFGYCPEIILWGADYYSDRIPNKNAGSWFVWDKTGGGISPNSDYEKMFGSNFELCWSKAKHKRNIIRVLWKGILGLPKEDTKKRVHPTQKPVELCSWFIDKFSKPNDNIVDPYGGSGSTLIACEKLGRRCFMMEIDPYYTSVILRRWANFTGKDPVREDGVKLSEL